MADQVDAEFLAWLRTATEARWASYTPFDYPAGVTVTGWDWARGTKWRGGLTEAEIGNAERRFGLTFPPDYREFLRTLHTTDPEHVSKLYQGSTLVTGSARRLYDWSGDPEPIHKALAWPLEGLLYSVEVDGSWHPNWGSRPDSASERASVVQSLVDIAPPLIPVNGHHYLIGTPVAEGNPVLSIHGWDVIVYADNLAKYLSLALMGKQWEPTSHDESADTLGVWADVIQGGI